jgi:uncharacterized protein YciI
MQFVVIAHDHKTEGTLERRTAVRPEHLARVDQATDDGTLVFAVALLDDDERMIGSVMVVDLPSRADVERWLDEEPYKVHDIWETIDITRGRVGPRFVGLASPS